MAKREFRSKDSKYRKEGKTFDTHTFGVRLLPRFTDTLSGEAELAGQGYGGLTYAPKAGFKQKFTGAFWILSGDADGIASAHDFA